MAIPVHISVVTSNVCRWGRRRGVGIGVSAIYLYPSRRRPWQKSKQIAWLVDARGIRLGEAKLWSGALGSITAHATFTSPTRLNDVIPMGTQHRGAMWDRERYAEDFLLLMSVDVFPFRGDPDIPNRELLELATGEGTKGLFIGCSCTADVMHQFMSASIIQVVSANLRPIVRTM
jgi:hypothetical protein